MPENLVMNKKTANEIVNFAIEYLIGKAREQGIDLSRDEICKHLKAYKYHDGDKCEPTCKGGPGRCLKCTYKRGLKSLINMRNMPNTVKQEYFDGDGVISRITFKYDPKNVLIEYESWEYICKEFRKEFGREVRCKNTKKGELDSYWMRFSKGMYTLAKFLSRFEGNQFEEFVSEYININKDFPVAIFALPTLLAQEVNGFRFALACDFLKECGFEEFVKPDIHIKDICKGLGIAKEGYSDLEIAENLRKFSHFTERYSPYEIDKLFWTIGSGDLYTIKRGDKNKGSKLKTNKKEFVERVLKEIIKKNSR